MQIIGLIIYVLLGLVQLAAVMAGLETWLGLHWLIAGPLAFIVAYVPFVGAILGFASAVYAWGWPWWHGALFFFGGLGVAIIFGGMNRFIDWVFNREVSHA